ncbi:MAG: hypothetical protein LUG17_03590, partial [Clostridiales bacterium]|nr:hypothetical protein [Clostridiales bacterium]
PPPGNPPRQRGIIAQMRPLCHTKCAPVFPAVQNFFSFSLQFVQHLSPGFCYSILAASEQGNANCAQRFFIFLLSFLSLSFRKKAVGPRPGGFCGFYRRFTYLEIFTLLVLLQAE